MLTKKRIIVIAAIVVLAAGVVCWRCCNRNPHRGMVYTSQGFGGYVPANSKKPKKSTDPLAPAIESYNKGKYREAEAAAQRLIESNAKSKDPAKRKKSVEARYILAFSSARLKDMVEARDRFTVLQHEAAKLPDKGKQAPMPGLVQPTLEEEGVFQCFGFLTELNLQI